MAIKNPYLGYDKDVRAVGNLWERFQAGLVTPNETNNPYYQLLLQEWQRCTTLGVDLAMTRARRLNDDEFHERLLASQLMLETYLPMIESVSPFLDDRSSGLMLLTDVSGCVLHMAGTHKALENAATQSGIVIGSNWDEAQAGNNGMGSVLAKQQPVHVFATEHFCESLQRWSCSAAPIFDMDGQTIIGTINFTIDEAVFKGDALALTVSLAHSLQGRLALQREQERNRLLAIFEEQSGKNPRDKILLDRTDRPISHTPTTEGHELAMRWRAGERDHERIIQSIEIKSPVTGEHMGKILHFAPPKPQGYERVFQSAGTTLTVTEPQTYRFGQFQSRDPETIEMLEALERIARADINVLLHGETGTGKELIARHIHVASPRHNAPYLAVNCGAISPELLESTFFGYVRGAFSGADPKGRAGYFESVGEGTLFLDEIGELPLNMQAALLRVLEDGSFLRVGSSTPQYAKCRIIAATHRNLEELIAQGQFRQDLYYRLKIVQKKIKPIRERPCDIPLLASHFKAALKEKHQLPDVRIHPDALTIMQQYKWPGNAREIRNVIEAALICSDGDIVVESLPPELFTKQIETDNNTLPEPEKKDLYNAGTDYERQLIIGLLRKYRKVNHVAKVLGLARSTLYRKFAELGIDQREHVNDQLD
ncbi:MAG: sigma-54-dependent Fis family transcriptional regulator [Alcaligenaceae bacterium]|nr:sigma-54-dependent Fis family transcriptional regulator [Alcaligenaceae bacterium]